MGVVGASVLLGLEASLLPGNPRVSQPSFSSLVASSYVWTVAAAVATCLACLVSDLRVGYSRSAYKARCVIVKERTQVLRRQTWPPGSNRLPAYILF